MVDVAALDESSLRVRDGRAEFVLDLRLYRLAAVQKAGYRLAREFTIALSELGDHSVRVTLLFVAGTAEAASRAAIERFFRELLDQELREKVAQETTSLRALLLALAFSRTGLAPREP